MKGMDMKKSTLIMMGTAVATLLASCATAPVALAPVGPNPADFQTSAGTGQLEVFSALSGRAEGSNPTWYKHTDYYLCDSQGRTMEHVINNPGHYAQRPRLINLAPGQYIVEARAKDTLRINVPVVIKAGEITSVHLDGSWQPPTDAPRTELVYDANGSPVGWHSEAQK
jgi:opacity protein-like surface antigen